MYKKIKIIRYKLREKTQQYFDAEKDFESIDNYEESIKKYIYSDIKLSDFTQPLEKAFQCRLQMLISSAVLRSILLKIGIVSALNNNNFPSYYASLKSFLEVPAILGYVFYLLHTESDYLILLDKLKSLNIGNKTSGSFTHPDNVEAINVLTMLEKAGKVITEIDLLEKNLTKEEIKKIKSQENLLLTLYKDICNFGHVNFNAHLSVGKLNKDHIWSAKKDAVGYKEELYGFYMPGFTIGISTIQLFCSMITRDSKVNDFNLLSSLNYYPKELI